MGLPDQDEYKHVCSSIVPGLLYVGGYHVANDEKKLRELGIRHIVRLGDNDDLPLYEDHMEMEYHTINIEDCTRSHLTPDILNRAIDFILQSTTPVLIHCRAGVSRSPAVAMAYLIRVNKMSYREARNLVQEKRPCASPNSTFWKDLQRYTTLMPTLDGK